MLFNAVGVEKESSASKNDFNPKDLAAQAMGAAANDAGVLPLRGTMTVRRKARSFALTGSRRLS